MMINDIHDVRDALATLVETMQRVHQRVEVYGVTSTLANELRSIYYTEQALLAAVDRLSREALRDEMETKTRAAGQVA